MNKSSPSHVYEITKGIPILHHKEAKDKVLASGSEAFYQLMSASQHHKRQRLHVAIDQYIPFGYKTA